MEPNGAGAKRRPRWRNPGNGNPLLAVDPGFAEPVIGRAFARPVGATRAAE